MEKDYPSLSIRDLMVLLIKHHGIHEGNFAAAVEFQIAAGAVGPDPEKQMPGIAFGISSLGLKRVEGPAPLSVDAAEVNPKPKARKAKQSA